MHSVQSDWAEGRLAQSTPGNRRLKAHSRAMGPLLTCALALGTLLMSSGFSQVLDGTILLPDSLGPLLGKNHIAFDEDSARPRMFVGGEDGDVIVANPITCERMARIETGPVAALCYSPRHNRLYVSIRNGYAVAIVDCSSYQVVKQLRLSSSPTGLLYNPSVDRIYCANWHMKIIDCATDSIVDSLPISARNATLALDALHNQLYVGATDSFRVIDCNRDSVIARYYSLRKAQAICCQPTARKVYVAAGESLFALSTNTNSIVYRQRYDTLSAQLACDPVHNRVYYSYWGSLVALDCASDSVVWNVDLSARAIALAAVPNQDKLCIMIAGFGDSWEYVLDGATGQNLWYFSPTLQEDSLCYASIADRVCVFSQNRAVSMLNVRAGTLDGIIPLGAPVSEVVADSTNDKLYFLASYTANACRIGVVDCYSRKVKSYSRILGGVLFTDRRCMSLDLRDQKLYCCLDSSIYVLDCGTDSVVKAIPTGNNFVMAMVWHPVLNKIYAVSPTEQRKFRLSVLDCSDDSVTSASDLSGTWAEGYTAFVDTVLNQFWLVYGGYTVVNCANDSVITETGATFRDYKTAGSDFDNHRVYVASRHTLYVIDTETRLPIDSIVIEPTEYGESRQVFCVPVAGKVFWTVQYVFPPIVDSVLAVDTHCDSIVARFTIPFYGALCDGRAGDYVYSSDCYEYLIAIDARTDSIVSGVHIPLGATYLVRNSSTNRLYALGLNDSVIQVVYDSVIFAGVRAKPTSTSRTWRPQTLLSRSTALRSPADAILFDATGRGVSVLTRGRNDISRLAPGVYFVREGMQASGSKSQTVLKVVIAR